MNTNQGALYFGAGIDLQQWRKNVSEMRKDILGLSQTTQQQTRQMNSSFKNLSIGIASYFSGQALAGFVKQLIDVRGEFQKTEIAFGTMLGSADKAKELMGQMVDLAAKTPFSLQDVSSGAKQLLAFQVPADEVVDTLTRMGNIAAGLGVPLSRINLVYGQVMAKGRLMGDDLRQFTEAGIPMLAELAKKFNTTTASISEMVSEGKIGFKDVKDVLFSLTNEGGMFFNLMEKQSKSLSGQWSNLQDSIDQMFNKIGQANEGILSDGIQGLNYLVEHYEDVIRVIGILVATYGTYRAALIAANALSKAQIFIEGTAAAIRFAQGISGMTKAQLLFNAAASANPYVLLAGALAAVVGAIVYFKTASNEAKTAAESMADAVDAATASASKESTELAKLYSAVVDDRKSREERLAAVMKLQKIYPSYFGNLTAETIMAGKAAKSYYELRDAIIASARAKAISSELEKRESERLKRDAALEKELDKSLDRYRKNDYKDTEISIGTGTGATYVAKGEVQRKNDQKRIFELIKQKKANQKKDLEEDKFYIDEQDKLNKKAEKLNKDREKAELESVSVSEEIGKKKEKTLKNINKDVEKIYGLDTLKGLQQRISKLNEIMETSVFGGENYNNAKSEKLALEEKLRSLTQTFDDVISETERQWNNYYRIADFYGKDTADAMYKDLFNGSTSYLQYLELEQQKLRDKQELNKEEREHLAAIAEKIQSLTGIKTPIENWRSELADSLRSVESIAKQIEIIEQKRDEVFQKEGGNSINFLSFNKEADVQIEALKNQLKDQYNDFLKEHQTFEEKKNAISEKYALLRAEALARGESTDKVDNAEKEELSQLTLDAFKNTELWAAAFGDLEFMSQSALKKIKKGLEDYKKTAKDLDGQELVELNGAIKNVDKAIGKNPFKKIVSSLKDYQKASTDAEKADALRNIYEGLQGSQDIFNAVGEGVMTLGDAFGGMSDATKDAVGDIMAIGNAAFDLGKSIASGDVAGMIKAGAKLIGSIADALSGDKKKERQIQKWAAEVKKLESVYVDLDRAISKALGEKVFDASKQAIANLRQQQQILAQMARTEASKKKGDKNKVQEYKNAIKDIDRAIEDMQQSMVDTVLNGMDAKGLADRLSDALVSAFMDGKDAAAEMGKAVDDILRDMVKNALKMKLLEEPMQSVVDKMLKSMGFDKAGNGTFDGLTNAEREELKKMMQSASQNYANALKEYEELFGQTAENAQGMKGDIKGVTEKTAGALESQINAMRINQVSGLEVMRNSLLNLVRIEENTRRLHNIDKNIQELNAKTKNNLAGVG